MSERKCKFCKGYSLLNEFCNWKSIKKTVNDCCPRFKDVEKKENECEGCQDLSNTCVSYEGLTEFYFVRFGKTTNEN